MKKVFTIKEGRKKIEIAVLEPSPVQLAAARTVANKTFRESIDSGAFLRDEVEKILKSRNLWTDDDSKQLEDLRDALREGEATLAAGGIKRSEGREIAMKISEDRRSVTTLLADKNKMDNITAEAQAENIRFDFLVSQCVVYNKTGKQLFKDIDDYQTRSTEPAAIEGAKLFAAINYGYDDDIEKTLPENQFLIQYGYVNKDLKFVNDDKQLVDSNGRRVDEEGRYIDDDGNFVDILGNKVDESGNLIVESKPFLDDEGNPIVLETVKAT